MVCGAVDLEASLAAFELAARLGHPQAHKDAERVRVQMRHAYATTSLLNEAMAAAEQRNNQTGRSAYTNAAVKVSQFFTRVCTVIWLRWLLQ